MINIHVQNFGKRLVWAECNHICKDLCTVPHEYVTGKKPPNFPVPVTIYDAEYDLEYVWLLNERARLEKELRDARGDTTH